MKLKGSCHCGAVRYTCQSRAPYPFMLCYCSICRKTAGTGGFAINLHADADTLKVEGEENISVYKAYIDHPKRKQSSDGERRFCKLCGTALWIWSPEWPELLHPHASSIDTALPTPPERHHIMLDSKAPWVEAAQGPHERHFEHYPDESLMGWHERMGLVKK